MITEKKELIPYYSQELPSLGAKNFVRIILRISELFFS